MGSTTTPAEAPINDPSLFVGPKLTTCKRSGWTRDEFFATFGEDDPKLEILDGRLFVAPAPFRRHNNVQLNLVELLRPVVRQKGLGALYAEVDVTFDLSTVLRPDLLILNVDDGEPDSEDEMIRTIPSLVIEILSRGTRRYDQTSKFSAYERFGVPHYWIVDPINECIVAFTLVEGVYQEVAMPSGILKAPPLGDFECKLEEIFRRP